MSKIATCLLIVAGVLLAGCQAGVDEGVFFVEARKQATATPAPTPAPQVIIVQAPAPPAPAPAPDNGPDWILVVVLCVIVGGIAVVLYLFSSAVSHLRRENHNLRAQVERFVQMPPTVVIPPTPAQPGPTYVFVRPNTPEPDYVIRSEYARRLGVMQSQIKLVEAHEFPLLTGGNQ